MKEDTISHSGQPVLKVQTAKQFISDDDNNPVMLRTVLYVHEI
jgi:hypothetical protein